MPIYFIKVCRNKRSIWVCNHSAFFLSDCAHREVVCVFGSHEGDSYKTIVSRLLAGLNRMMDNVVQQWKVDHAQELAVGAVKRPKWMKQLNIENNKMTEVKRARDIIADRCFRIRGSRQ